MPNPHPRAPRVVDIRSMARLHTEKCIQVLGGYAANPKVKPEVRIAAIAQLLDRGWGRAPQAHTGEDGEGDIRVTIRHIIEDARGMVIEGKPEQLKLAGVIDG